MSKETQSVQPKATPEVEQVPAAGTNVVNQSNITLAEAAKQLGKSSIAEVQAEQARLRTTVDTLVELTPERVAELDGMDVEQLASEIKKGEDKVAEIRGKMAKAQAKVEEVLAYIDGLRAKYALATKRSDAEVQAEYFASAKQERIDRFKDGLHARGVLVDAGVGHLVNLDTLGLGVSPADQAIAANIQARRNARNREVKFGTGGR